jgi:hypothetical membrane protein
MMTTTTRELDSSATSAGTWPLRISGWAGVAGPILFTVVFGAQDVLRAGYDPVSEPISALAAGAHGWVQQLNFVAFGVLTLLFAVGLHAGIRPTRFGIAGPGLLFVSGVGLLLAAAFPLRENPAGEVYDPGGHIVGGLLFFPVTAVALVVLAGRLARDPRWRDLTGYVRVTGILSVVGVAVIITLVLPDGGALHDWAGLTQRLLLLTLFFPCRVALGARLLRVARSS